MVEKSTGPPGKVQKSLLDEEGRGFKEDVKLVEGNIREACKKSVRTGSMGRMYPWEMRKRLLEQTGDCIKGKLR